MNLLFTYICTGILFVLPGEFLNHVIVQKSLGGYVVTLALYAGLLVFGFGVWKLTLKIFWKKFELALYAALLGFAGLMLEWFAIGNSPWQNPDTVQISMFAWWVGVFTIPRLFLEDAYYAVIKRWMIAYHIVFSAVHLAIATILPEPGGTWLGVMVFSYGLLILLPMEGWYLVKKWRQ